MLKIRLSDSTAPFRARVVYVSAMVSVALLKPVGTSLPPPISLLHFPPHTHLSSPTCRDSILVATRMLTVTSLRPRACVVPSLGSVSLSVSKKTETNGV